jgi:hypothetical protein
MADKKPPVVQAFLNWLDEEYERVAPLRGRPQDSNEGYPDNTGRRQKET